MSKEFKEYFEKIVEARNEIDSYVWDIFNRYIKVRSIHFNAPEDWYADDDASIVFSGGVIGNMGCYDDMQINIELKYFINPDEEFKKLEKSLELEKQKKQEDKKKKIEEKERKDLEKLKKKYE